MIRTRLLRITGLDEHLIGTSAGARRLGRLNWHKCGARQRSGIKWHKWSPRPKSYFPPVAHVRVGLRGGACGTGPGVEGVEPRLPVGTNSLRHPLTKRATHSLW